MSDDAQNANSTGGKKPPRYTPQADVETLLKWLRNEDGWVRWSAARDFYFLPDIRAVEPLTDLLKNDPELIVRRMASQALGAIHDAGIEISLFAHLADESDEARKKLAIDRLKELGAEVWEQEGYYRVRIPHQAKADEYLEMGYLMAQLVDTPFQEHCATFADVPSLVMPDVPYKTIESRDSDPGAMRFIIYPKGQQRPD